MLIVDPGSLLEFGMLRLLFGSGSLVKLGVMLHLGNKVQSHLPYHRGGKRIAEMTVENEVGEGQLLSDQVHHLLPLQEDALQLRREGEVGFVLVFAALGTTARSFGSALLLFVFAFSCLLLLFFGANNLLDRERIGASLLYVNDRDGEECQTRNDSIEDRREEPADPIGVFSRFAHHTLVARQQINRVRTIEKALKEAPLHLLPVPVGLEEAVNGAITASLFCPSREA